MKSEQNVEAIIDEVLGSLGERPTVEQSTKAQTALLAAILRELSDLKTVVRKLADDDDNDDDRDAEDDERNDDDGDDDPDDDSDENRRDKRGKSDDG